MFLTRLLCSARSTPGRQWGGKHRKTITVTKTKRATILKRERHAEEMTTLLSTPYLTMEEDQGHAKERKAAERAVFRERVRKRWGLRRVMATKPAFTEIQSLRHSK